jgi:hypothetical protein
MPFMALCNNLVLHDQHQRLNTMAGIQPELATSWSWDATQTMLTRQPHVQGFVLHRNGIYNNWRFDDVWLEE